MKLASSGDDDEVLLSYNPAPVKVATRFRRIEGKAKGQSFAQFILKRERSNLSTSAKSASSKSARRSDVSVASAPARHKDPPSVDSGPFETLSTPINTPSATKATRNVEKFSIKSF